MPTFPRFLEALKAKQLPSERDGDFADRLGISRGQWNHLRRGARQPTLDLVRRACAIWPELLDLYWQDIVAYVSEPAC